MLGLYILYYEWKCYFHGRVSRSQWLLPSIFKEIAKDTNQGWYRNWDKISCSWSEIFVGGFAWIFSEIKRGWIFPEIEWGMDFLGNQMGVAKKIKNNNMIRLVPSRIEIQIHKNLRLLIKDLRFVLLTHCWMGVSFKQKQMCWLFWISYWFYSLNLNNR